MTQVPFRVAMIGGGLNSAVGRTHEIAMRMDGAFELVAGCFSRNQVVNAETAVAFRVGAARTHASAAALIAAERGQIDALVIATPIDSHADLINQALDAGLTVICDKPLLASVAEGEALLARVAPETAQVFSIFNYTGYPAMREMKRRIEAGEIGEVFKIMAEMPQDSYLRLANTGKVGAIQPWRLHDGSVPCLSLDLFAHIHSLVNFITGCKPLKVSARSRAVSGVAAGLIDEVDALIDYENNLVVNAWYGKVALGCRNGLKIRVFGTRGSFEWIQEDPELIHAANAVGDRLLLDRISSTSSVTSEARYNRFKAGHPAGFIEAFANYYLDIARAMQKGVLNEYTLSTGTAIEGIALSHAIHESSTSGRKISLK
ncbi:Gfo/Idh/MocA family protein [Uliginosibacterium sp. TH139]|uniref:Gfo/Idh/MocA family protein n=1 Tax=Uliginosibacterium sp. TH139 TaxID=2067453 RepID=UPI000C7CEF6E|nr:Gfo/Idh/MocA family oxidoreductase [Uliginosibacterium sp. TH139]PLK48668.1 gfo/Idh/MocA family oxidoreductase [Uliginosibacterium sp. TH139]